jgi:hypothetical protein
LSVGLWSFIADETTSVNGPNNQSANKIHKIIIQQYIHLSKILVGSTDNVKKKLCIIITLNKLGN